MQRSQQLAAMFLLGAFMVGGTLGFTADRLLATTPPTRVDRDRATTDAFAEEMELSTTQRAVVDTILAERNRVTDSLIAPVRPQMRAARDEARRRIALLLNEVQQRKFDAYLERMRRADSTR